jgi:hypothetical protein
MKKNTRERLRDLAFTGWWRSLGGPGLIRRVLGVIVRVGRVCSVVVGHVRGWMRIHISTVGRHEKIWSLRVSWPDVHRERGFPQSAAQGRFG